jgi:hypothetical protein
VRIRRAEHRGLDLALVRHQHQPRGGPTVRKDYKIGTAANRSPLSCRIVDCLIAR